MREGRNEKMKSDQSIAEIRFGREIQKLANRFRRLGDENLQKEGITFSQLRVIAYISKNSEAVLQKELEEFLGIRRSSVTSLLQHMEKSGILARSISKEDSRIKTIFLTEKGKKLDEDLKNYIQLLEEHMLAGFSDEEKDALRAFLARMQNNLEETERSRV
jgi:DNA-binding MarR family transcriptional regulator